MHVCFLYLTTERTVFLTVCVCIFPRLMFQDVHLIAWVAALTFSAGRLRSVGSYSLHCLGADSVWDVWQLICQSVLLCLPLCVFMSSILLVLFNVLLFLLVLKSNQWLSIWTNTASLQGKSRSVGKSLGWRLALSQINDVKLWIQVCLYSFPCCVVQLCKHRLLNHSITDHITAFRWLRRA